MSFEQPVDDAHPAKILIIAQRNLERVLEAMNACADDLEAGRGQVAPEAEKIAAALRKAIQSVLDERKAIGKLLETHDPDSGGVTLDLDQARDEIWRRLAVLKDARGAGDLPEQPE